MTNLFASQHTMTYRANLPQIDIDFYDYLAKEDECAAERLDMYLSELLQQRASIVVANRNKARLSPPEVAAVTDNETTAGGALKISAACKKLINTFKEKLDPSRPQVLVPADLTSRLARNIVRMVEGEHKGIRGCAIVVVLHDALEKMTLGKIVCDPACPTSTTLYLHLNRIEDPAIRRCRSSSSSSSSCNSSTSGSNDSIAEAANNSSKKSSSSIYISPGYTLEKRRKTRTKRRISADSSSAAKTS